MVKKCSRCEVEKPHTEFWRKGHGLYSYCKPCARAENRKHTSGDKSRDRHYRKKYGITLEEYDQMFSAQGGVCACCGTDDPGAAGRLVVDHDHTTGDVRGLLCSNCNTAYGMLDEEPRRILALLNYHYQVTNTCYNQRGVEDWLPREPH